MFAPRPRWKAALVISAVSVLPGCAADTPLPSAPVVQTPSAASCTFTLSLAKTDFDDDGEQVVAKVWASDPNCRWTWSVPNWIEAPAQVQSGDAEVSLRVLSSAGDRRVGEVSVGAARVAVAQDAYDPFFAWAKCKTPIEVGVRYLGVCETQVRPGIKVTADLRPFGYSGTSGLPYTGDNTYHFDLTLPGTFQRGVITVTFTGTKPDLTAGTRTALLEVR